MNKYTRAGIIIALLCIILVFVVLVIHSCASGQGVKLEQSQQPVQQSVQQSVQSVQEYQPQVQQSVQPVQPVQQQSQQPSQVPQSQVPQSQVPQSQVPQETTQIEQVPSEIPQTSVKEYQLPQESSYISDSRVAEQATFVRINKDSIKYWYTDRTIQATVVNTEVYYSKEESALYYAVIVKGEDSGVYRYFVSAATFEQLQTGNVVSMVVRTYENNGQKIIQVLSMSIIE